MTTSKVLYFDQLPPHWTARDLAEALAPLAEAPQITRSVFLHKRNALYAGFHPSSHEIIPSAPIPALAEIVDLDTAVRLMETLTATPLTIDHADGTSAVVAVSYSKNQELHDRIPPPSGHGRHRRNHADINKANRILLVTVQNPTYPITTELMHGIFKGYGAVEKIVIFVKPIGLQQELIVKENGLRTRDFTNPDLPAASDGRDTAASPVADLDIFGQSLPAGVMPAIAVSGRDAVVSPVLLVCSLREKVTCDNLFNLFSCYGNVVRVKKLSAKPDHALVQFLNPLAAQSALIHLRGYTLLGKSMEISFSKYMYISNRAGSTENPLVKEYNHLPNRFTGKAAMSLGKHVYSPTKLLHLSNFDESTAIEMLKTHLGGFHGGDHCKVKTFMSPSGHLQALAEFASVDTATNVLAQAHNSLLGAKPLKFAFSNRSFH
uniref:RRM domain-containing protein n=1 Tax=Globisporangium ultimum (strain ATCC 200006 / CBS 805.95 / DAOM BR144) TaxID=431595 RepID=K3XA80_GLOUD